MEVIPPSGLDPRLVSAWRKGFAPPERLSIQDFSAKYISLPASYAIQGAVDLNRSRYMLPVLEALQDPKVRIVAVQAAVQCGKSLLADLFTPWVIVNSCGSILWLTKDEALAKTYAETRVTPVLYGCEPVRTMLPSNRFSKRKTSILFPNSTVFLLGGANEGNVHSLSVRYLILDEAWTYKPGIIEQALARVKAFPHTSKVLVISQGAEDSHDFTALFRRGHCAEWGWTCPHCQNLQPYAFNVQRPDQTWAGVAWDKNELTKPNDRYNLVEVAKTTRLECFHCKGVVTDTPANRRNLNDTGDYVIGNPNADPTIKSFTWQALANIDISFSSVASQYIQAKEDDQIIGNRVPLQNFTQQVLAKPWNPNAQLQVIRAAIAEYDPAKDWADEAHRFFMVDVQADCYWAVCRAWSRSGESRLIWCGKLETIQQVRDKQIELGVKDQKTFGEWLAVGSIGFVGTPSRGQTDQTLRTLIVRATARSVFTRNRSKATPHWARGQQATLVPSITSQAIPRQTSCNVTSQARGQSF